MAGTSLTRAGQFLDVSVRLGRSIVLQNDQTRVQVLVDVRPVADIANSSVELEARVVLDQSGSMGDYIGHGSDTSRLDAAKQALSKFVAGLGPRDRAMLITFSEGFEIVQPLSSMDWRIVEELKRKIALMRPLSNTRFSEAMGEALGPRVTNAVPAFLLLLTDGNSTVNQMNDYARMVRIADQARQMGIPLLIYGTGTDYNWSFLNQLAARAGNGSFCKHVLDMDTFEGHLMGELAFRRGISVEGLTISGRTEVGQIVSVTRFMPMQFDLPNKDTFEPTDPRPRDFFTTDHFSDGTGSLDHFRGQQLLIEVDIPRFDVGKHRLLRLAVKGRVMSRGLLQSCQIVDIPIEVTDKQDDVPAKVDPEIMRILRMMAARKLAEDKKFEEAAVVYQRAGDQDTAEAMHTLHQMSVAHSVPMEDITRAAHTCTGFATSMTMTVLPDELTNERRRHSDPPVDTDSGPSFP